MPDFKKLGEIATYINGYAFKPADRGDTGLPIIRIQDLTGNAYDLGFYDGEYPERVEINNGDVLISWSASLGVYIWDRGKALLNQHIFKVVFDKVDVDKQYFVYAVRYSLHEMESKTHGATMKHIVKKDFDNTVVPFPNIERQAEIATTLAKAESIIYAYKQELQTLDELIKARFVEMFGDVITNSNNWDRVLWNNVLIIKNGKNQKNVENKNGVYPICGSGGIMGYADDYISEENSVIIGRKGNINKPILMREKYWNVDTAFGLEPNEKILTVEYLYWYCCFFDFEQLNKAVTIPSLTKADLLKIEMPTPPIELQSKFADFIHEVDKSKVVVQKAQNI